ncbi:unnamed protein product [Acanthoscelides obtectus]|uniref:Uncharacterized protein n=1 Tax=Acanthoscelides obtectus TaxID=200917 RepID=A0A9P0JV19_ACAOB|nr:unnamed protein product [Acanthoscelides obtectus]CAK1649026.1 hypothetical protein AOBTE_LOCUS16004 [Acanthoscelides obtectus]
MPKGAFRSGHARTDPPQMLKCKRLCVQAHPPISSCARATANAIRLLSVSRRCSEELMGSRMLSMDGNDNAAHRIKGLIVFSPVNDEME